MSVTIDSLDIQIRSSAGSAAANIDRLADALGKMRANAKLTAVTNNLTKLSEALGKLQGTSTGLSNIRGLAGAMKSLSQVQKSAGFNSLVNTLKKLPDIVNQLDAGTLATFTAQMRKLAAALAPLANQINTVGVAFSRLPARISQIVTGTNKMASASRDAADAQEDLGNGLNAASINLASGISILQSYIGVLHQVRDALAAVIAEAIEWDGIQFRFGRAFGEDADEVYDYILRVNDAMQINTQQFMQYSSLYGSLLSGFGIAQEKITSMSVGLSELSYDIWAAYNDRFKTLEDASEAVRSAITGEIEPIRNAGIALTEASMQEYLANIGMAQVSVEKLTEAQKSEVRYAVMVNAALNQGIVGTYAREMNTAEGAVRTLAQQMKTLVQSIGSLFIPILQVVVPWVSAFVSVLTDAAQVVAKFFGIPWFEIDWSSSTKGVGAVAAGAKDASKGMEGAADAAKKLKSYTMGFDELNVIDPPSDSSSGGAGGGAGAEGNGFKGLDLDTLWDDSVLASAKNKIEELKPVAEKVLKVILAVGAAFAAWKISKGVQALLGSKGVKWMTDFGKALMGSIGNPAAASAVTFMTSGLSKLATTLTSGIFSKGAAAGIFGAMGGGGLAASAAAIGTFIGSIGLLAVGLYDVFKNSELFHKGLSAIKDLIVLVGKGVRNLAEKWFPDLNFNIGGIDDKLQELTGGFIGLGDIAIALGGLALFGPWGLAIAGVILAIKGLGAVFSDVGIPAVDLFGDGISAATKEKVEPFLLAIDTLDQKMKTLDWGDIPITVGDAEDIKSQLNNIVDIIVAELDSDKNEALTKLEPLRNAFTDSQYADLLASIEASYAKQNQLVLDGETEINAILALAAEEKRALTQEESDRIAKIQKEMRDTGIKYLSDSETESNLILQRLKDNATALSAEQASEIIKSAAEARDETIKSAKEQYDGILLEAQRMLDTGVITKDEYDNIIDAAESTRDETVKAAEDQYADILATAKLNMGEYADYIDEETGEMKNTWEIFWIDTKKAFSDGWKNIKDWWKTSAAPVFTKEYWKEKFAPVKQGISDKLDEVKTSVGEKWDAIKKWFADKVAPKLTLTFWLQKFTNLKTGFTQTIKNAVNAGIDLMNKFIGWLNEKLHFSWDALTLLGKEVYPAGSIQLFTIPSIPRLETGGFLEDGLFTMNHGEIAGKFNNGKSVVANNQQIVEGIAAGVYEAVVAAMSAAGGRQDQSVNVYLDGKQITAAVEKRQGERGRSLMGNQLGYVY